MTLTVDPGVMLTSYYGDLILRIFPDHRDAEISFSLRNKSMMDCEVWRVSLPHQTAISGRSHFLEVQFHRSMIDDSPMF